ncbi:MAG: Gfo/Idh/MocA family oxidoreductase [Actinomycetes bacterium]
MAPLRIGILGAARIAPAAVVVPARTLPDVEVVAVAARDRSRAAAFAAKRRIPVVHDSYDALIADPDVDAVYNPLPNGLHGHWTVRALEAGKHVLCEKPFAANADEAAAVAVVADRALAERGLVTMEAFHYRYHPLAELMCSLVREGRIGAVRHLEARAVIPFLPPGDIRFDPALAGGSLMDLGCYPVHQLRSVAADEPTVVSARAKVRSGGIDRWITADLRWPDGRTGRITAALMAVARPIIDVRVQGDEGRISVFNPTLPQLYNRITVRRRGERKVAQRIRGESTYWYQLRAFADAVTNGEVPLTSPADAVANLTVIDAIYRAAGLPVRVPTAVG